MTSSRLRWGILGTSKISEKMARAINESDNGYVYAIASRSQKNASQFASQFSIPHAFDNQQAILSDSNIDVVYIGLPHYLHKEWIIRCAFAGKHVLCEKPLVLTVQEAREVCAAVNAANIICMEALMYRHHPFTYALKKLIHEKTIGEIRHISTAFMADIDEFVNPIASSPIYSLGCYPVSLIQYLLPESKLPKFIHASAINPHQTNIVLEFDTLQANITVADDIGDYSQVDIFGTHGQIRLLTSPWIATRENNLLQIISNSKTKEIQITADKSLYAYQIDVMNHFIRYGNESADKNLISLQDSLSIIEILEQWHQQISKKELSNEKSFYKASE